MLLKKPHTHKKQKIKPTTILPQINNKPPLSTASLRVGLRQRGKHGEHKAKAISLWCEINRFIKCTKASADVSGVPALCVCHESLGQVFTEPGCGTGTSNRSAHFTLGSAVLPVFASKCRVLAGSKCLSVNCFVWKLWWALLQSCIKAFF